VTVVDPRAIKKAQALSIVAEEPWSTTEEVAAEMKLSSRLVRTLLMDLLNDGKLVFQQKSLPRRKVAVMWRATDVA